MTHNPIGELELVWLQDPSRYEYLREAAYLTRSRRQFPVKRTPWPNHPEHPRVIGYAVGGLDIGDRRPVYQRRFWDPRKHHRGADWGEQTSEYYANGRLILIRGCRSRLDRTQHAVGARAGEP